MRGPAGVEETPAGVGLGVLVMDPLEGRVGEREHWILIGPGELKYSLVETGRFHGEFGHFFVVAMVKGNEGCFANFPELSTEFLHLNFIFPGHRRSFRYCTC